MKIVKKLIYFLLIVVAGALLFIWWANYRIESKTKDFVTSGISKLPNEKVGLLLGTSKTLASGFPNLYFKYRIDATAELYKAGKIQNVIVSGDNSHKDYNEPKDMKLELIKAGIPEDRIFEDFAGFRTLDSVIRARDIFGQKSYIVISQEFHNERAVFLARKNGIDAYGYNAADVNKYYGFKTNLREYLARAKVFVDFFTGKEPKYRGEKILIP